MKNYIMKFLLLVLASALSFSCSGLEIDDGAKESGELPYVPVLVESGPAVSVNGYKIDEEEIRIFAAQQEQEILDEFVRKYHAVPGEGFWRHSFEEEVPLQHLVKWTVYKAVWIRLAQEMAVEHGIRTSVGLEDKKTKLEEENRRRLDLKEKGETIYGPDQYTLEEFYPIDEQSLELALIQVLESKDILREEGRGRDRRIHRIDRMKMALRQLIEKKMEDSEVRINELALVALISPEK
jgi:hypothetical protein